MKYAVLFLLLLAVVGDVSARRGKPGKRRGHHSKSKKCFFTVKNCKECQNGYDCSQCENGFLSVYMPLGRACWTHCPLGFVQDGDTCRIKGQECKVENCELCRAGILTTHRCNKCKVDFHKFSSYFEDMCLSQCPDGYYSARGRYGGSVCRKGELPMTDEPVTSSEPTPEPETTAWTETSTTTDPFTEPEYTTSTDVTTELEPSTSTETTTTSDFEPTTISEQTTTPEPTSEWEWTTSAEPSTEPESTTTSPEPTTEPESTTTGDSVTIEAITAEPTTEWDEGDWP